MSKIRELVIFGAGGHAVSVADVALSSMPDLNLVFIGVTHDHTIFGFPVIAPGDFQPTSDAYFHVAIGDNKQRAKVYQECMEMGLNPYNIISPQAHLSRDVCFGEGNFIAHGAHIGPESKFGDGCIINTHAVIDHEAQLGNFVQVCPNAAVGGKARIGNKVFIGLSASVIDRITITDAAIIGANATVVDDLQEQGVYVGTPAARKLPHG